MGNIFSANLHTLGHNKTSVKEGIILACGPVGDRTIKTPWSNFGAFSLDPSWCATRHYWQVFCDWSSISVFNVST